MDERNDEATARRVGLGAVVRALRGTRSLAELGELLGGVSEPTVWAWEEGHVDLTYEQVRDIEEAVGVRPGTAAVASGYLMVGPKADEGATGADPAVLISLRQVPPERTLVGLMMFQAIEQALEAVEAADTLHLGVDLSNTRIEADEENEESEWWSVRLWTDVRMEEEDA